MTPSLEGGPSRWALKPLKIPWGQPHLSRTFGTQLWPSQMSFEANQMLGAVTIGIGATLVMDLWNLLLRRVLGIPSLNYFFTGALGSPPKGGGRS